jgi:hypothetical protein
LAEAEAVDKVTLLHTQVAVAVADKLLDETLISLLQQ